MINLTGIKASVKRWSIVSKDYRDEWKIAEADRMLARANKLRDYIKKREKSWLWLQVLIDFYFTIQK